MSDQQHIDDLFKQEFNAYAPPVPEGTFERIIEERKKRRVAIVWWRDWRNLKLLVFFVSAALVAGGSFLFLKEENTTTIQSSETAQLTSNTKAPVANNDKEETTTQPDVEGQPLPAAINTGNNALNDNASGNSSTQVQTLPGNNSSTDDNAPNVFASGKSTTQPQPLTLENSSGTDYDLFGQPSSAPAKNTSRGGKTIKGKRTKGFGRTLVNTSAINIGTADSDNDGDASGPSSMTDQKDATSKLYKIPFDLSLITASSLADSNKAVVTNSIKGPDCPEAEKNAAGNKTYWEAYTSADYGSKKYTDTANSLFAAKRKETTSFYSAFSAGVRVTKVFNNGVSVRAGLNFSQINEKFSFVQSNTVQTTYIIDAVTGDTTGSYIVRGTKYKTSFNQYRTLDIPLVIGYEVGNGRLHANFNAGAIINLYSWQKGELLDTSFQPVSITTGKGLPAFQYKTNIGVGFTAGASVYYKLNDRLHLLAEPYFRYNFSPMNKEALSLQERFTTIGLRLGIRIDF